MSQQLKGKFKIYIGGYTSADKTTAFNALIGQRVGETGLSRTTREQSVGIECTSDDGVEFIIYDLPGLGDAVDKKHTEITNAALAEADLVLWASPIDSAFLTDHEVAEFKRIQAAIENLATSRGIGVQLCILITKAWMDLSGARPVAKDITKLAAERNAEREKLAAKSTTRQHIVELTEDDQDSSYLDNFWHVKDLFPGVDVIPFNAFGHIIHNPHSSKALCAHIGKYNTHQGDENIRFAIKKYSSARSEVRDTAAVKMLMEIKIRQIGTTVTWPTCNGHRALVDNSSCCGGNHGGGYIAQGNCMCTHSYFTQFVTEVVKLHNSTKFSKVADQIINWIFADFTKDATKNRVQHAITNCMMSYMKKNSLQFNTKYINWKQHQKLIISPMLAARFILMFDAPRTRKLQCYFMKEGGASFPTGSQHSAESIYFRKCHTFSSMQPQFTVMFEKDNIPKLLQCLIQIDTGVTVDAATPIMPRVYYNKEIIKSIIALRGLIFGEDVGESQLTEAMILHAWPANGWLWPTVQSDLSGVSS